MLSIQATEGAPKDAHEMVQLIITMLTESFAGAASRLEVRENASLPGSKIEIYRFAIILAGFGLGLIAGFLRNLGEPGFQRIERNVRT